MAKTYLVEESVVVLLHNQKLIRKVPISLHAEQIAVLSLDGCYGCDHTRQFWGLGYVRSGGPWVAK